MKKTSKKMLNQLEKDFILNGTKDRAFSSTFNDEILSLLQREVTYQELIVSNRNIDIVDYKRMMDKYLTELTSNKIANCSEINASSFMLAKAEEEIDSLELIKKGKSIDLNDKLLNTFIVNTEEEITCSIMPGFIEINNYAAVIAKNNHNYRKLDKDNMSNQEINWYVNFNPLKGLLLSHSKNTMLFGEFIIYTEIKKINANLYKFETRTMIGNARVVYNFYFNTETKKEFDKLDPKVFKIEKYNNLAVKNIYARPDTVVASMLGENFLNFFLVLKNKEKFVLANVLNKNYILIESLFRSTNTNMRLNKMQQEGNEPLSAQGRILKLFIDTYRQNTENLSRRDLEVAYSTFLNVALNLGTDISNNLNMLTGEATTISKAKNSYQFTFQAVLKNIIVDCDPKRKDDPEYMKELENLYMFRLNDAFERTKAKQLADLSQQSNGFIESIIPLDFIKASLSKAKILMYKVMFEGNSNMNYQVPESKEDKITMLSSLQILDGIDKISPMATRQRSIEIANALAVGLQNELRVLTSNVNTILESIKNSTENMLKELKNLTIDDIENFKKDFDESKYREEEK